MTLVASCLCDAGFAAVRCGRLVRVAPAGCARSRGDDAVGLNKLALAAQRLRLARHITVLRLVLVRVRRACAARALLCQRHIRNPLPGVAGRLCHAGGLPVVVRVSVCVVVARGAGPGLVLAIG